MKNNKFYLVGFLVGFILILCFSFILQGTNIIINEQDDKDNRNVVPPLTASNSVVYEWNRTWGGVNDDSGYGVAVDSSGNIYLSGHTWSFGAGSADMVLVKYDGNGIQQWNRTWGGIYGEGDWGGIGVKVDSLGNVYLIGYTFSIAGGYDIVLVKYDGNGVQQWNRTWGGVSDEYGWGIAVDSSGNVYLTGEPGVVLIKYDGNGVLQWNRTWHGGDGGIEVAVDSSDNVYITGMTSSLGAGLIDMVLVKYNGNGVQQWYRTWGGGSNDAGFGVTVDSADNIYLTGRTESFGQGLIDAVLVKYDSSGVQQWNRTWGGVNNDIGFGVTVDSSDNVYLVGGTDSFGAGDNDMVLVKYDSSGVQQWNCTWGGEYDDNGWGIEVDSSNNLYLAGNTESFGAGDNDMVLVKYVVEEEDKDQVIFGYDLFLFISTIGVIIAISLKKKYK